MKRFESLIFSFMIAQLDRPPDVCMYLCHRALAAGTSLHLRSREISASLEAALKSAAGRVGNDTQSDSGGGADGVSVEYDGPAFELQPFRKIWLCLTRCWDPEVQNDVTADIIPHQG